MPLFRAYPDRSRDSPGLSAWSTAWSQAPTFASPIVVGRYAVFDEIAAGGMGTVHFGRLLGSAGFERVVAIKRMHPAIGPDTGFAAMFREEIRLLALVRHPRVVAALDVVEDGHDLLLIMEYVHGLSLSAITRLVDQTNAPIPVDICATIACGVLDGLQAVHSATTTSGEVLNIVHRDISPQNIMVGADGLSRILDFGVAKASDSLTVTRMGQVKGKLGYIAPEHLNGLSADHRSDIYGLSVVLWEMLARTRLFDGKSDMEIAGDVLDGTIRPIPPPLANTLPDGLERLVRRGLSLDRDERFSSAREMALALQAKAPLAAPERVAEWLRKVGGATLKARVLSFAQADKCRISFPPRRPRNGDLVDLSTEGGELTPVDAPAVLDARVVDDELTEFTVPVLTPIQFAGPESTAGVVTRHFPPPTPQQLSARAKATAGPGSLRKARWARLMLLGALSMACVGVAFVSLRDRLWAESKGEPAMSSRPPLAPASSEASPIRPEAIAASSTSVPPSARVPPMPPTKPRHEPVPPRPPDVFSVAARRRTVRNDSMSKPRPVSTISSAASRAKRVSEFGF